MTKERDRAKDEDKKADALVAIIKLKRIKANKEKNNTKNTATEETLISANYVTTEKEETQENQNKNVKYTPFKSNMSVAFKGILPSLLGGKSLIEQKKDHLANFIKDEGITTSDAISADSTNDFYADIMEVGSNLTYNTINNNWYLDGSMPEPSQNQALDLVHRIYARLLNSARE